MIARSRRHSRTASCRRADRGLRKAARLRRLRSLCCRRRPHRRADNDQVLARTRPDASRNHYRPTRHTRWLGAARGLLRRYWQNGATRLHCKWRLQLRKRRARDGRAACPQSRYRCRFRCLRRDGCWCSCDAATPRNLGAQFDCGGRLRRLADSPHHAAATHNHAATASGDCRADGGDFARVGLRPAKA
jgi:hypothetical protein